MVKRGTFRTRLIGFGPSLVPRRSESGTIHIDIRDYPSCTWVLEDDIFVCTHDQDEVVEYVEDHMGINGPYQTEYLGYACADCGEPIEGDPIADRQDAIAEAQLMEILGK